MLSTNVSYIAGDYAILKVHTTKRMLHKRKECYKDDKKWM